MSIKIHMLNVGDADAIIVQLQKSDQKLTLLIDGGKGHEHAELIIDYFKNFSLVPELIICGHLDKDHIGGLGYLIAQYYKEIKEIWVHRPENHDKLIKSKLYIDKLAYSKSERRELILASLQDLDNFINVAEKYGLKNSIFEPFSDTSDEHVINTCTNWGIKILGPSKEFYANLIPRFRDYVTKQLLEVAKFKSLEPCELIGQEGGDKPENESSLIFQITDNGKNFLFTGDAGLDAFEDIGDKLENAYWLKVPHHGCRKNLNAEVIEKIQPAKCFISAVGKNGHPDPYLVSCLKRHKADVKCTGEKGVLIEQN